MLLFCWTAPRCDGLIATNGDSNCRYNLTSRVGAGSSWHVLLRAEPINFSICSDVTDAHLLMTCFAVTGTSRSGTEDVFIRAASILFVKNLEKSSAMSTPSSTWLMFCPSMMPDRICQSFLVLPPAVSNLRSLDRQCWQFFFSYSKCIFLSCSIHNRRPVFDRVLRCRISSILECLRMLRHSASNYGVRGQIFALSLFSWSSNVVSYRSANT